MVVRISIDRDACTGHGRCHDVAPELFEAGDDGSGIVVLAEVPTALEAQAWLAVGSCPEGAIRLDA